MIFDSTPTFTKSIAPLLYDKKFSYGIRLDDGLYKAFTNVFAVLYGGVPDEQNNFHDGIRSTDGCENEVIWAGDFAIIPNRHTNNSTTKYTTYNDPITPTFTQNASKAGRMGTLDGNFDDPALIVNSVPLNDTLYIKVEGVGTTGFINAMKIT